MKPNHKNPKPRKSIMEKPFLEATKSDAPTTDMTHAHTIYGVHPEHQAHVNRLAHTDPELWTRLRSWN